MNYVCEPPNQSSRTSRRVCSSLFPAEFFQPGVPLYLLHTPFLGLRNGLRIRGDVRQCGIDVIIIVWRRRGGGRLR